MPTAEAKARAWTDAVERDDVPNETMRSIAFAFHQPGQDDVLRPYLAKYLAIADHIWEERGVHHASTVLTGMFPTLLASQDVLDEVDRWLADHDRQPGGAPTRLRRPRRRRPGPSRPSPRRTLSGVMHAR